MKLPYLMRTNCVDDVGSSSEPVSQNDEKPQQGQ
jgi:hypothetical protein